MMAKQEKKGRIALVSSTLGYMSFLGWASHSPAKHALRGTFLPSSRPLLHPCEFVSPIIAGLADTLQSELMLYGISVHIFFPPTMFTPGYDEENKTKPQIVKDTESTDDGLTADQAALALYKSVFPLYRFFFSLT